MNQNDNSINLLGQTIPAPPSVTKIRIIKNTFGFYEKWTFMVKARLFSLEYELLVAQPEHLHCFLKFTLFGRISSGYLHYLEPEFSQDIYTIQNQNFIRISALSGIKLLEDSFDRVLSVPSIPDTLSPQVNSITPPWTNIYRFTRKRCKKNVNLRSENCLGLVGLRL